MPIKRFDGTSYQRLLSEPITLREIGLFDGQLVFLDATGNMIKEATSVVLKTLFSELIKAYVRIR